PCSGEWCAQRCRRASVSDTMTAPASARLTTKNGRTSRGNRLSPPRKKTAALVAPKTGRAQAVQRMAPPARRPATVRASEAAAQATTNHPTRHAKVVELRADDCWYVMLKKTDDSP